MSKDFALWLQAQTQPLDQYSDYITGVQVIMGSAILACVVLLIAMVLDTVVAECLDKPPLAGRVVAYLARLTGLSSLYDSEP